MHNYLTKRNKRGKRYIVAEFGRFKLKEKELLYPRICVCIFGETDKNNYKSILKEVLSTFDKKDIQDIGFDLINPDKISLLGCKDDGKIDKKTQIGIEKKIMICDIKDNVIKSIDYIKNIEKEIKEKEKKKLIDEILKGLKHASKNIAKKNVCFFRFEFRINIYKRLSKISIEKGKFLEEIPVINDILSIYKKYEIKAEGHSCNDLAFDTKSYRILGGMDFPLNISDFPLVEKIPFAKNLMDEMGSPKLGGVSFSFEKSPLGLEKMSLHYKRNKYIVNITFKYKTDNIEDLMKKNYLYALNISQIFLRKIK